jgi:hypothetical protein
MTPAVTAPSPLLFRTTVFTAGLALALFLQPRFALLGATLGAASALTSLGLSSFHTVVPFPRFQEELKERADAPNATLLAIASGVTIQMIALAIGLKPAVLLSAVAVSLFGLREVHQLQGEKLRDRAVAACSVIGRSALSAVGFYLFGFAGFLASGVTESAVALVLTRTYLPAPVTAAAPASGSPSPDGSVSPVTRLTDSLGVSTATGERTSFATAREDTPRPRSASQTNPVLSSKLRSSPDDRR